MRYALAAVEINEQVYNSGEKFRSLQIKHLVVRPTVRNGKSKANLRDPRQKSMIEGGRGSVYSPRTLFFKFPGETTYLCNLLNILQIRFCYLRIVVSCI